MRCLSVACSTPTPDAVSNANFRTRSHRAVIRVYDEAGNVIETHEHAGDFKEPCAALVTSAAHECGEWRGYF
jgi:hypothetical protein